MPVPSAITDLTGTVSDTQIPLTWTAPADGGSAITDYIVEYREDDPIAPTFGTAVVEMGTALGSNNVQSLPASSAAGDLIIYAVSADAPSTVAITASTGWLVLSTVTGGSNVIRSAIIARVLDGTSGDNILSISGHTQDYVAGGIRVPAGTHGCTNANLLVEIKIASVGGSSSNANPPSLDTGLSADRLWIAAIAVDGTATSTIGGVSANYDSRVNERSSTETNSCMLGMATRSLTATQTSDPGAFTSSAGQWIAWTIAIPPAQPWLVFSDGTSASTGATVTGLTNNTPYEFRVSAVNSVGTGPASNIAGPYTPVGGSPTVPGAPTNVIATLNGSNIDLDWTAPASDGGSTLTDYVIRYSSNAGGSWDSYSDSTSTTPAVTVIGLVQGTYIFQIAAVNAIGQGTWSVSSNSVEIIAEPSSGITQNVKIGGIFVSRSHFMRVGGVFIGGANEPPPPPPGDVLQNALDRAGFYSGAEAAGVTKFANYEAQMERGFAFADLNVGHTSWTDATGSTWGNFVNTGGWQTRSDLIVCLTLPLRVDATGNRTNLSGGPALINTELLATANGANDSRYTTIADRLIAAGHGDAILRIGHEGEITWYPWAWRNGNHDAYIAAFRHVVDFMRAKSAAFRIDYQGNNTPWSSGYTWNSTTLPYAEWAYPGDAYVDIIGVDPYDRQSWANTKIMLDYTLALAISHGKQMSIPEWGLWQSTNGDDATFVQDMYDWLTTEPNADGAGSLAYHCYFWGHVQASFDTAPLAKAKYKELFAP